MDPTLAGGKCLKGACACSLCAAGTGCRLAQQLTPGLGRGVRIVADVGVDQVRVPLGQASGGPAPDPGLRTWRSPTRRLPQ